MKPLLGVPNLGGGSRTTPGSNSLSSAKRRFQVRTERESYRDQKNVKMMGNWANYSNFNQGGLVKNINLNMPGKFRFGKYPPWEHELIK